MACDLKICLREVNVWILCESLVQSAAASLHLPVVEGTVAAAIQVHSLTSGIDAVAWCRDGGDIRVAPPFAARAAGLA